MGKRQALLSVGIFCMAVLCQAQERPIISIYNKVSPNKGFTITSHDADGKPFLIGYSDTGQFDMDNIPPNVSWWLSQYCDIDNTPNCQLSVINYQLSQGSPVVGPLLTTTWNQEAPYNTLCPTWFGEPTMAGCVPTAVAQILNYYRWPVVPRDSITYYCHELLRDISADFSQSRYDYDKMPSALTDSSTEEQIHQVAKLMYDCGVALQAEFWTTNTGAKTNNVEPALVKYFRYEDDIHSMLRQNDTIEWDATIRHELDEGRPVYYAGTGNSGSHAFVCDGYDTNGLFHFNFGWGGKYDGYYRTGAISNSKIHFSTTQRIIYNIHPNSEIVSVPEIVTNPQSQTISSTKTYDLTGRPVTPSDNHKGLVIKAGKKIFIR